MESPGKSKCSTPSTSGQRSRGAPGGPRWSCLCKPNRPAESPITTGSPWAALPCWRRSLCYHRSSRILSWMVSWWCTSSGARTWSSGEIWPRAGGWTALPSSPATPWASRTWTATPSTTRSSSASSARSFCSTAPPSATQSSSDLTRGWPSRSRRCRHPKQCWPASLHSSGKHILYF